MWRKREDEWAREEQARERLMNEVKIVASLIYICCIGLK